MSTKLKTVSRAAVAALAFSFILPGVASVQAGNTPQGVGGMSVGKPDITAAVGYLDGKKWTDGGTHVLNNMGFVQATRVGPKKNMCRFKQMDLQPKNAGLAEHGAFLTKVYRDNILVHTEGFAPGAIPANSQVNFRKWTIDLKEGINTVKVSMDANKQVAEAKESNNNYAVKFNVKLDCNGDGHIGPVSRTKHKAIKKVPTLEKPEPRRSKPRS